MKVQFDGLCKILARQTKMTKEEVAKIVERDGANSLDKNIVYLGFGIWEIKTK